MTDGLINLNKVSYKAKSWSLFGGEFSGLGFGEIPVWVVC